MKSNAIASAMLVAVVCVFGYGTLSAQTEAQTQTQEEILRPGDQIQLRISGVPPKDQLEITGLYTVDGEGKIRLTHIKSEIQAKGLRPSMLAKTVEAAYVSAQIFTSPRITINVDGGTTSLRFVSVSGEVNGTGDVPYRPDLTLLAAISARGGFTDYADVRAVKLMRGSNTTKHNMKAISSNPALDVKLRPGDKIIVSQRSALPRIFKDK
ncbi:MAG: polysaccharide biosynthesis/export family protein [Verrucomicrobia bacterium]|nr:polysaccharide biosynthesis/export family protein [Verrucomicrobiota bacterium]